MYACMYGSYDEDCVGFVQVYYIHDDVSYFAGCMWCFEVLQGYGSNYSFPIFNKQVPYIF